jgi:hypothetical protein
MRHGHLRGGLILVDSELNDTAQGSTREEGTHKLSELFERRALSGISRSNRARKKPVPSGFPTCAGCGAIGGLGFRWCRWRSTVGYHLGCLRQAALQPQRGGASNAVFAAGQAGTASRFNHCPTHQKNPPGHHTRIARARPSLISQGKRSKRIKDARGARGPKSCVSPRHSGCPKRTIEVFTATSMAWCFHGSPKGSRPP